MLKQIKYLNKAIDKYQSSVGKIEREIAPYIDFEFSIIYHDSDGFCLLEVNNHFLAPLEICLIFIQKNKKLTFEDFRKFCI